MGSVFTSTKDSAIPPSQTCNEAIPYKASYELSGNQHNSNARLKYTFPFIVWAITAYAFLYSESKDNLESIPYLCSDILGYNLCSELTSFEGSYRLFFTAAAYHLILAVALLQCTFCIVSTKDSLQNNLWTLKILLFAVLTVGAFFIPQKSSFVIWVSYFSLLQAFLFLILQFFLLIDVIETFIEFYLNTSDDLKSKHMALYYSLRCIMILPSVSFLALTIFLVCVVFLFTSRTKCKWNDISTSLILCLCFVAFALSLHPKVRPRHEPELTLLPGSFIALYTVLLLLLAVTLQHDTACNLAQTLQGYDLPIGPNVRSIVAALIAFVVLVYASLKAPSNSYINRLISADNPDERAMTNIEEGLKMCQMDKTKTEKGHGWHESNPIRELRSTITYTFDEQIPRDYNYSLFHFLLSCASLYLLMSVTNWYEPFKLHAASSSESGILGLMPSWTLAEIATRIASFVCVMLYIILMLYVIVKEERKKIENVETPTEVREISFGEAIKNLNIGNPDYRSPSPDILLDTNGKMNLSCYKIDNLEVIYWHFPKTISQSYYGGRNGSNACTIIAMLIARTFYLSDLAAPLPRILPEEWFRVFVNCISEGNRLYDSIVKEKGEGSITLAVDDVAENFGQDFEVSHIGCPLPVTFKSDITTETLLFQLGKHKAGNERQCLIFIKDFRTGVFLIQKDGTLLFADSHPYGSGGAILVCLPSGSVHNLCKFLQAVLLSRTDTLGTITSVKFSEKKT